MSTQIEGVSLVVRVGDRVRIMDPADGRLVHGVIIELVPQGWKVRADDGRILGGPWEQFYGVRQSPRVLAIVREVGGGWIPRTTDN